MAFTVFGVLGTADVNAAKDDAAISVVMWYGKTGVDTMPAYNGAGMDDVLAEKTLRTFTRSELESMDKTEYNPYCFTGKGGAFVVRARGVLVSDLIKKANVDQADIIDLKTAQLKGSSFMPNNGQKDYLTQGVTYTGAKTIDTNTGVADDTESIDVPFIIATSRFEETFPNDGTITVKDKYDSMDKGAQPLTNYRNFMGSKNTKDFAGNRYVSNVDSIVLFKTASADDVTVQLGDYGKTYDGMAKTPEVTVKIGDTVLKKDADYTVEYGNNVNAGNGTAVVTGKTFEGKKTLTFAIDKAAQVMSVKAAKKTLKARKLKKKVQTVKALTVGNANGIVSYKKISGSKKLTVNSKTGKISVKKKTKKGTYKVKVRVSAAGDQNYTAASRTVTVTVKVKK